MNENMEVLELLRRMEAQGRRQLRLEKLRCVFSLLTLVCVAAVVVLALDFLPQLQETVGRVDTLLAGMEGVMGQLGGILSNLEESTRQLAGMDLESMVTDVNNLVLTGQSTLEQTMEKLNAIDFEALNKGIQDLATVIEPLAKVANMFG